MLAGALLSGCAGQSGEQLDPAAERACDRLQPVVDDVEGQRLQGPPLYRALQDVYDEARTSEVDGFAEQAQRALSAAVNADQPRVAEHLQQLRERCRLIA